MRITIEISDDDARVTTQVTSSDSSSATAPPSAMTATPAATPSTRSTSGNASDGGPAPTIRGDSSHGFLENAAVAPPDAPAPFSTAGTAAPTGADMSGGAAPGASEPIVPESAPAEYDVE
ncbi:MAG TPA: hypothetical protein VGQ36_01615 [Thermoanaerobaculia bacterium]|jgi:hypothetical protein|nr:hypothetical protein [Thermoanaerobaculia bacterium]